MTDYFDSAEDLTEAQKQDDEKLLNEVKSVLSTVGGRDYIFRLLERAHLFNTSFNGSSTSEEVAFREGERNFGLMLLSDIELADKEIVVKMITKRGEDNG